LFFFPDGERCARTLRTWHVYATGPNHADVLGVRVVLLIVAAVDSLQPIRATHRLLSTPQAACSFIGLPGSRRAGALKTRQWKTWHQNAPLENSRCHISYTIYIVFFSVTEACWYNGIETGVDPVR